MNKYEITFTMYVLGYEKTYTIPVLASNEIEAQLKVLEGECHNASYEDIHLQVNNPKLFEVDDMDFFYKINYVEQIELK